MAFWAYFFTAYAYNDSDDFEKAEKAGAKAQELARSRGSSVQAAAATHPSSFLNLRWGRVEAAVADAEATVKGAERGWRVGLPSGVSVLGEALLERGELDRAAEVCRLPGATRTGPASSPTCGCSTRAAASIWSAATPRPRSRSSSSAASSASAR